MGSLRRHNKIVDLKEVVCKKAEIFSYVKWSLIQDMHFKNVGFTILSSPVLKFSICNTKVLVLD